MLKYLFTLTLLVQIVFCRVAPEGRQWQANDSRQHCVETCSPFCLPCLEPTRCNEADIKCGEQALSGHEDCPKDDICVPDNCECKIDDRCPLICAQDCDDDREILCPGGESDGCRENDYCHDRGTGTNGPCPGYCPFDCLPTDLRCPVPDDPFTGCEVPPLCIPKQTDKQGNECTLQQCPLLCDFENEQFCPGSIDNQGCKEADQCLPLCYESCPVDCSPDEIKCKGLVDFETDCVESDTCKAKARDYNNEPCPDDSYSHGCPIRCRDDEVLCQPAKDALGCLEEAFCAPISVDNNNITCPITSDCPTNCGPNEVKCPQEGTDDNGCNKPDICKTQERDWYGDLCTVHCPLDCNDDETYCPGQRNEMGCFEPDQCITRAVKTEGSDKGGLCPGWCPPICDHDEIKCPSQVDPCDGCPTEEVCREAATDRNGVFCPVEPLSASHNCPILCDDLHGQVLCPSHEQTNGCKDAGVCMDRTFDKNDQYCPAHSVCPANCESYEIACSYGVDARECQEETICQQRYPDSDGYLCPGVCPPTCTKAEVMISGGTDAKGCELPPTCELIVGDNKTPR